MNKGNKSDTLLLTEKGRKELKLEPENPVLLPLANREGVYWWDYLAKQVEYCKKQGFSEKETLEWLCRVSGSMLELYSGNYIKGYIHVWKFFLFFIKHCLKRILLIMQKRGWISWPDFARMYRRNTAGCVRTTLIFLEKVLKLDVVKMQYVFGGYKIYTLREYAEKAVQQSWLLSFLIAANREEKPARALLYEVLGYRETNYDIIREKLAKTNLIVLKAGQPVRLTEKGRRFVEHWLKNRVLEPKLFEILFENVV